MEKTIELRRHTSNDGDVLTPEGIAEAVRIGSTLTGPYDVIVSSGAQRATQSAACFLAGAGMKVSGGIVVDEGFRSQSEDRWREIYSRTGRGELAAFLDADASFVETEAAGFAEALRRVANLIPDDGHALVVGHSPMLEAAVWAATGRFIGPLSKGEGVFLAYDDDAFTIRE